MDDILDLMMQQMANDLRGRSKGQELAMDYVCHKNMKCAELSFQGLDRYAGVSIKALIMWAAVNNNIAEQAVMDRVAALFDVKNVEELDACNFDAAVRYLVEGIRWVN